MVCWSSRVIQHTIVNIVVRSDGTMAIMKSSSYTVFVILYVVMVSRWLESNIQWLDVMDAIKVHTGLLCRVVERIECLVLTY